MCVCVSVCVSVYVLVYVFVYACVCSRVYVLVCVSVSASACLPLCTFGKISIQVLILKHNCLLLLNCRNSTYPLHTGLICKYFLSVYLNIFDNGF